MNIESEKTAKGISSAQKSRPLLGLGLGLLTLTLAPALALALALTLILTLTLTFIGAWCHVTVPDCGERDHGEVDRVDQCPAAPLAGTVVLCAR